MTRLSQLIFNTIRKRERESRKSCLSLLKCWVEHLWSQLLPLAPHQEWRVTVWWETQRAIRARLTLEAGRAFQFTDHNALALSRKWERDRPMPMRPPKGEWALRVHWESSGWVPHLASKTNWNTKRPQEKQSPHVPWEAGKELEMFAPQKQRARDSWSHLRVVRKQRRGRLLRAEVGPGDGGQKLHTIQEELIKVADRRTSCYET